MSSTAPADQALNGLLDALQAAQIDPQVEDLLDALWLATRGRSLRLYEAPAAIPPTVIATSPTRADSGEPAKVPASQVDAEVPAPPSHEPSPGVASGERSTSVFADGQIDLREATMRASPVALPAGRALSDRLPLSRALKPFRQRWPSRSQHELDEELTAEMTAELGGQLHLAFQPLQERWFDVDVVIEDDAAMGVWTDTLRDFSQMLRDTGAFRDVHLWRLRMPDAAAPESTPAMLEGRTGKRIPARSLAGSGTRRLVFFATHGSSRRWLDGSYARLLAPWIHSSSVVLLHLLERRSWKRAALGEPHGVCHAQEVGAITSTLRVQQFWWALVDETAAFVRVPIAPLTPSGIGEWSQMQMARGRRSAVVLLDPAAVAHDEEDQAPARQNYERAVALLREASPEAFRLAVYLCAGSFTIPVARLVQEAKFGAAVQQRHLSEVLLSGLVVSRSPEGNAADPNELYYEFRPEARAILLRSLREADADLIAGALERRVSQYIEQIYGRAITFRALVPDENGKYNLPHWAQPFAHLGLSLLRRSDAPAGGTTAQLASHGPALLARAAQLCVATPLGAPLNTAQIDPVLVEALATARIVQRNAAGQWTFMPGIEPLLQQAANELLKDVRILWVDDIESDIVNDVNRCKALGAAIEHAVSTAEGLAALGSQSYDLVISDMTRRRDPEAGFDLLSRMRERGIGTPLIFYSFHFPQSPLSRRRALQAGAFACTNSPTELLDRILEALGRSLAPPPERDRALFAEALRALWPQVASEALNWPEKIARQILAADDFEKALRLHLQGIRAMTESTVNQIIRIESNTLRVISAVLAPDKAGSQYQQADWDGLIGRAAREGRRVWVPDVALATDYIAAEPGTKAELVLPIRNHDHTVTLGVLNIEMERVDALNEFEIQWLERFCAPLGDVMERSDPQWAAQRWREAQSTVGTAAQRSAEKEEKEMPALTAQHDYAIVVGVDPVGTSRPADFEANARDFADWLRIPGGAGLRPQNVHVLLSKDATREAFASTSKTLAAGSGPRRRLYLYFGGHVFADERRSSLFDMDFLPEERRPPEAAELFGFLSRSGLFREVVVLLEKSGSSPPGRSDTLHTLFAPGADAASPAYFYAHGKPGSPERRLTTVFLRALSTPALLRGSITSDSLLAYLRQEQVTADFWTSGNITLRAGSAGVTVFVSARPGIGIVRILEARDRSLVAEARLNEGSCHFQLQAGAYLAHHVESGVQQRFEVEQSLDPVKVMLADIVAATGTAEARQQTRNRHILVALDAAAPTAEQTNVIRFQSALAARYGSGRQVSFYVRNESSMVERLTGRTLQKGIDEDVQHSYRLLVEYYEPGDRIYLLGAGRGSLAARQLAGLVSLCGLLPRDAMDRIPEQMERYRKLGRAHAEHSVHHLPVERPVEIEFIGVWDTIGPNLRDAVLPRRVRNAFHALAIDEVRSTHQPMLWSGENLVPGQRLEQRWFAGDHADVTGGYPEHAAADIPLRWMMSCAAECGLAFKPEASSPVEGHPLPALHRSATLFASSSVRAIGTTKHGNEVIDPSVLRRFEADPDYRPPNLVEYLRRHPR